MIADIVPQRCIRQVHELHVNAEAAKDLHVRIGVELRVAVIVGVVVTVNTDEIDEFVGIVQTHLCSKAILLIAQSKVGDIPSLSG